MKLQELMKETKTQEEMGKKLSQISLENYITTYLGLSILEVKEIEVDYEDAFEFRTTNGTNEYIFKAEHYDFESFAIYQNVLILTEIRGKEGVFKTNQRLWVKNENTPTNKYLTTPLKDLLKGTANEAELQFVLNYLKTALETVEGYSYKETKENDISSFCIEISDDIHIQQSFSNTIQLSFRRKQLRTIQIIFKEQVESKLIKELEQATALIRDVCKGDIRLDHHSITDLYDFFQTEELYPIIHTSTLIRDNMKDNPLLFHPMTIGEYDSYHQVQITIYYQQEIKGFIVDSNYLFKSFSQKCKDVKDVKEYVETIKQLVRG